MRDLQTDIVEEMGVKPEIDPAAEVSRRVEFLVEYAKTARAKGFVLGISGGVDSSLAGRLCQLAVERLREQGHEAQFHAVRLPHGVQHDADDADAALEFIAPDQTHTFNIEKAVNGVNAAFDEALGRPMRDYHRGNVKARLRMTVQYAIGGENDALVIGTDHGSESITGFFTKYGDGGADVLPLFTLNKRQVRQLLRHLGASETLWSKAPTADLLDDKPGQLDETELGISYDHIDDYLEGREIPDSEAAVLEEHYLRTRHKRTVPVTIQDDWWRHG
ncbi:ammonia-dependent NAD(+) synthetase [Nesterenkonia sp. E16_7]|uniref:ammonia-dependent NAD(+) synthetase n=1 Tax=unclassified Nesterenkonia TaxID=2629769 RepID=UPI001A90D247|nr:MULTISPECIES: ammonia-dependent NAD(+) synthetase [unclassified Nesterenkonia]MBO0595372.1 ammonia-dependent NAD(+) synthetase [Nesterenkonia sp. E16_10]MBO0599180.1 ammonia-dependent NAD(+) synthetase [Nesterenkonia sp. E16_7]